MDDQEFNQLLEKYAEVVVKVGLNLRNDQHLSIRGNVDDAPFIRKVAETAYKAGARYVDVLWDDENIKRTRLQHADPETLTTLPDWLYNRYEEYSKRGDAELAILSSNPDLYNGIDSDRIAITRKTLYQKIVEPLRKYNNYANWCVVSTAAPAWAQKVFPNLPEKEAQTKLWDAIFRACRIHTPDPVKAWEEHIQKLDKYKNYLNAKRFASLRYKAPGTDLTIGLPEDHHWGGAQETFKNGITGTVNIPTEEVFTMPHKNKVDGLVTATLPLNNQGVLMEEFSIRFENGRAVNFSAKKGDADLRKLIETDENAGRLGEVALVPNSSPISQSGILFYNTLFDENASCHLALGSAYKSSMQGGVDMTDEEFAARGGNKSLIHVDFMIGSAKMDIDGIQADGTREPLMRNGEWAFSV
ncbi:MAG TPA: aminopeptidase [Anaerolineales bacterium]|nr:aminopeptidase [Anaerolineales bacterium]HMX19696.1 aminopeptidase [Anaerolineales bacterium]HMX74532.1 aminopeptidase [Anaerolineales bacterium]HMZ43226.1 aminopeptidase [Anaerolineales bacterium]HNA54436.1 aminopeptidase [Anaerolineales bacterium]